MHSRMMVLLKLLKFLLDEQGIAYSEAGDTLQMTMCAGGRRWNAVLTADAEGFLRYYARYPMKIPASREGQVLAVLNRLNGTLRAGCFMLADGYPIFRYGAYIFDEFTAEESVADLIAVSMAKTADAWDVIAAASYRTTGDGT